MHIRSISCRGFRRTDGLWDIEGHLTDTKSYAFHNRHRGEITPGLPIHDMSLRLTVDEEFLIHAVEAVTDAAPFHPCAEITPNFQRLVGMRIGPGFTRRVREKLGGREGCTHLVELIGPLATTAFQSIFPAQPATADTPPRRPRILDTCHALVSDGEVVRLHWPDFYDGPNRGPADGPAKRD